MLQACELLLVTEEPAAKPARTYNFLRKSPAKQSTETANKICHTLKDQTEGTNIVAIFSVNQVPCSQNKQRSKPY
jgi:hypothetical protein